MKKLVSIATLSIALFFNSCTNGQNAENLLSPEQFQQKTQEHADAPVVDVRTPEEYAEGHLPKAQNVNWNGDNFDAEISKYDKEKTVFVYCRSGGRSASAVSHMQKMGFKHIIELDGGILNWESAHLPTEH